MGKHSAPRRRPPGRTTSALLALALLATAAPASPPPAPRPETGAPATAAPAVTVPPDAPAPDFTRTPVPPPTPRPAPPLTLFLATWEGRSPVIPGYSTAECVAVFALYHYDVVGGGFYTVQGAKDLWALAWPVYTKISPAEPALPGDVVIWAGSYGAYQGGGYGHVAIVTADHGNSLDAFGQNPNPATTLRLSKSGVLGYLRPNTPTT